MDTLSRSTAPLGGLKPVSEYERYLRERKTIFATAVPPDEDDDDFDDDEEDDDDAIVDDDDEDEEETE